MGNNRNKERIENELNTKLGNVISLLWVSKTFSSITFGNSSEWNYTVPTKTGNTRVAVLIQKVAGSGSNSAIVNIHGDMPNKMISVHAAYSSITNLTVHIVSIYIKDAFLESV